MEDPSIKKQIFLKKSKLRKEVYQKLNAPKIATDLAKELKKHRSSISRVLLDLEKAGYIKCINSEDVSFRHYVKI